MIVQDIDASGWNTYKRKITDLQSGNRGRDSKIMSGLLDSNKSVPKDAKGEANTHTDVGGNLCARNPIRVTRRNG